jgi:RNA polymerase sigma-70 factor (ECF subfamily)
VSEPRPDEPLAPTAHGGDADADRAAVLAARAGDTEAFGALIARHERRLFGLAWMVVRDRGGAEDLTQDAFVRAFTKLDLFDARRPFYPWLATIAVRLAQNWLSRRARRRDLEGPAVMPELDSASASDPLCDLIADEGSRRLWRSVASLPPGERTAVLLFYRQDMKVGEIAEALGVTAGTVKTWLFRARRKLRVLCVPGASGAAPKRFEGGRGPGT